MRHFSVVLWYHQNKGQEPVDTHAGACPFCMQRNGESWLINKEQEDLIRMVHIGLLLKETRKRYMQHRRCVVSVISR